MNIPLDRLYHYIRDISQEIYGDRIIIYRFWPHGSKNINNLTQLYDLKSEWYEKTISPLLWCHDQEPLNYEFYKTHIFQLSDIFYNILKSNGIESPINNLNYRSNIFEKNLLLHSEIRSNNLEKYRCENELIPVYYWSHAIIARDWFRYAEHETFQKCTKKTFLIYNRAWSGTREYRLQFAELLIRLGLENSCQTSISPVEPELGIHYELHKFKNSAWRPTHVLENFFPPNNTTSHYSADFDIEDYKATDVEVVLETLFDDDRLHLTEKSLRPIACGQPFILAGTQGSLEYLRSYGFKTFGHVWDERYDECADPEERLRRIVDLMKQIANWTPWVREQKIAKVRAIADYNKKYFFSKEFFDLVSNELKTNLTLAFKELNQCKNYKPWINRWTHLLSYPEVIEFLNTDRGPNFPNKDTVNQSLLLAQNKLTEVANKNKS